MNLADDLVLLHEKLAQLEQGRAEIGDWHRLEARAGRALVHGQTQLARLQREMIELQAEADQSSWTSARRA